MTEWRAGVTAGTPKPGAARPILVVDADAAAGAAMAEQLLGAGFDAVACASIGAANDAIALREGRFIAVVIDAALPDGDGPAFCRDLRRRCLRVPIVMLSDSAERMDAVAALNGGADDCVFRPFGAAEFMARLRAALRAYENSSHAALDIGRFEFRPATRLLMAAEGKHRPVRITEKESRILLRLYKAQGEVVTRRDLLADVWGHADFSHVLDSHVYRLRQRIEPDPHRPVIVLTAPGGYRLGTGQPEAQHPA